MSVGSVMAMTVLRWLERPRLLAGLTLVFALVPAWYAVVMYRNARQKDERVFETTVQVLGKHFQNDFEATAYLPRELRNRAHTLDDNSLRIGEMMFTYPWKDRFPHVLALGYAELVDGKLIVRWKSEERVPVMKIGDDLMAISGVLAALKTPQTDPSPVAGCVTEQGRMLMLLAQPGVEKGSSTRGYMVGWIDLNLLCRNSAESFIHDEVLMAAPQMKNEAVPTDARRVEMRILGAAWAAVVKRGARFNQQYGVPTPWLIFIAVGFSAVPLLLLASLAGRSAKLRADLTAEKEVARQQRYFTQSVSHEFRTPLGIILSGADLLESYAEKLTPERRRELVAEIKSNTLHMTEMIERVLLLGRIDSNRLICEPRLVNVAALCRDITSKVAAANPGRSAITLNTPECEVLLDASLMGGILGNLLSNALKYSAPSQPVKLSASVENRWAVFTVRDEGIGIPTQDLARVCDPFHRCSNVGETPGTGLGTGHCAAQRDAARRSA